MKLPTLVEARRVSHKWLAVVRWGDGRLTNSAHGTRAIAERTVSYWCSPTIDPAACGAVFRIRISKAPAKRKPDPRLKRAR